jgi:hypothetical protein
VLAEDNDMRISQESEFIGKGDTSVVIPVDLAGKARTLPPDLGAYQHVIIED